LLSVSEASAMFSQVKPFSTFLKALHVLGFNYKQNSWERNFLSVVIATPALLHFLLCSASILQSENIEEVMDRLLYIPVIVGLILKATNLLFKFEDFKLLMGNFNEAFKDEKLKKNLKTAARKINLLVKVQYYFAVITAVLAILSFYATYKLTVPYYVVNIPNHENAVFWFNKFIQDYGILFTINIFVLCDLLPVCLMAALAEHCKFINESFSEAISIADLIKCIKLHRKQHQ